MFTMSSFAIAILFFLNTCLAAGPAPVPLGTAINCVILAKSGVSCVPTCHITGNVCVSPAGSTSITGCGLTLSTDGTYATSSQITGRVYAANYASPTPADLTTEVSDMGTAYNNAAGRTSPDYTNLDSGAIGGLTLAPGLYKWTTGVSIASPITISGTATDTWIFQVAGTLTIASGKSVILSGGALPANIVWVVAGAVTLGASSVFDGIILGATSITMQTGSSITGRLFAQTAVALQAVTVTQP